MSIDGLVLTVLAVLAGIFVGLARGGRFRNIVGVTVRAKGLLLIGVVVPALADEFTREVAVPLVVGGLAALFAFAIVNVRIVGMSVMAVGILANLLATFLNGGLPVNREALVDAGLATPAEVDRVELRGARRLEEPTHRVRFLGDIIPLEETGQVLAFGDLVILVGLADITANLTLHKRKRSRTAVDGATTETAGEPPSDDAVAVIDLVRLHEPRGGRNPRPRAPGTTLTEPEPDLAVAVAAAAFETTASPDVDWWPRAELAAPVDSPADSGPLVPELVEEPVEEAVAEVGLIDEPGPIADLELIDLVSIDDVEPMDEPEPIDREPRWAPEPATVELRDAPWSTEPRWAADPVIEIELAIGTHDLAEIELEIDTDDSAEVEIVIDTDESAEIEIVIDVEDAADPEPEVAAEEPVVVASAVDEVPVIDLREHAAAPPPRSTASTTAEGIDDELFHLLFADLSKSRRHRRRGERTIPDFEPVHVDDITLPRR